MNKNAYTILALGVTLLAGVSRAQTFDKYAVNIVFTDPTSHKAVDTIIDAGHDALHGLLHAFELTPEEVMFVHIDKFPMEWTEKGGAQKKIMVLETGEAGDGEQQHVVQVIKVEGDMKSLDDLSEEERQRIHEELMKNAGEGKEQMVMEKKIVLKHTGEPDVNKDIRIEKSIENGKEVTKAYVDGMEVSEEEARAIMEEEEKAVEHGEGVKQEFVFISDDQKVADGKVMIEHRVERSVQCADAGSKKAVAVIKGISVAGAKETAQPLEGKLHLYPNPAKREVTVNLDGTVDGDYTISITNLAGQNVWSADEKASEKINKKIDLEKLSPGTYILSVSHGKGVHSQKLVIE